MSKLPSDEHILQLSIELPGGVCRMLYLLPSGGVVLADTGILWVADVHLGKAASYRRMGQPVPSGTTTNTLNRLARDIERHAISHVVVLGDLMHDRVIHQSESTLHAIASWRARFEHVRLTLVRGNHDRHAGDAPAILNIQSIDQAFDLAGIWGCHDADEGGNPSPQTPALILSGHVHPVLHLRARGRQHLRLPCFYLSRTNAQQRLLLPAYGDFTGGHPIKPSGSDRCFVVADQHVLEIPGPW
jgi:uncharacterized protein